MNMLLLKNRDSRKRQMVYHIPAMVSLNPKARLIESSEAVVSLRHVFEQDCLIRGVDPEDAVLFWRREINTPHMSTLNEAQKRREIFDYMCNEMISDQILSNYVTRMLTSPDQLFHFRKEFALQLSLTSFLSHVLFVGERNLHRISFSRTSARIIQNEFFPLYDERSIVNSECIPFRFTRNLSSFLTPKITDGIYTFGITAIALCANDPRSMDLFRNLMSLYFRDDLLSNSSDSLGPDDKQREFEYRHRDQIDENVRNVKTRVFKLCPELLNRVYFLPCLFNYI